MTKTFITVTHLDDYNAAGFCNPGTTLILKKVPNEYDDEAIAVFSEKGSKYGYVAHTLPGISIAILIRNAHASFVSG